MKKILVTTTESLFGWEIESYLQPIHANMVVGGGMLSDIGGVFSDLFGSRSSGFEKKLTFLNEKILEMIKAKAAALGANAIVGLRVDVDQAGGKEIQAFMVSAWATAVVVKNIKQPAPLTNGKEIDKNVLNEQARLLIIKEKAKNPEIKLTLDEMQLVADSKSSAFADYAVIKLRSIRAAKGITSDDQKTLSKYYKDYFSGIGPDVAVKAIYPTLSENINNALLNDLLEVIRLNDLVDFQSIIPLLNSDKKKIGLQILKYDKAFYSHEDLDELETVIEYTKKAFPNKPETTMKKGFLSSAEKPVWTCSCGQSNNLDHTYCVSCSLDHNGFETNEVKPLAVIEMLSAKLGALRLML